MKNDFDILVTDFRMDGMNGVELARKVHEKNPAVPVIIVTGYGPIDGGKDVVRLPAKRRPLPQRCWKKSKCSWMMSALRPAMKTCLNQRFLSRSIPALLD